MPYITIDELLGAGERGGTVRWHDPRQPSVVRLGWPWSAAETCHVRSGGPMEAKLTVVAGKTNEKSIALTPPTKIGRSRDADLTIPHPMISRQHCELFEADGLLMVRDVGSLNGTMMGGRRIKESPLPPTVRVQRGTAHVSGGIPV